MSSTLTVAPCPRTTVSDTPNIWSTGQLLGFSGLDGPVVWHTQLVLQTGNTPGSLQVRIPFDLHLALKDAGELSFHVVLGDALSAESPAGDYRAAFVDGASLVGHMPSGARWEVDGQLLSSAKPLHRLHADEQVSLYLATQPGRWALFVLPREQEQTAEAVAIRLLHEDVEKRVAERSSWVCGMDLPPRLIADDRRLLRKCLSVMKVNVLSPAGRIGRRWTTPDRWPHRNMWLWDSAFHALAWLAFDPALAKDAVLAILEQAADDGRVPLMAGPFTDPSAITQPPLLAWAAMRIVDATADHDFARACLGPLQRYLDWDRLHRDANANGLPEWYIEHNPLCRAGESGMDNSPRFDRPEPLDAVDFAALLAHDYACLGKIASAVGNRAVRTEADRHAAHISRAVEALLWDEASGFYRDRWFDGQLNEVKAVSGFFPLLAGTATAGRARRVVEHLSNPSTFGSAVPIPSVALDAGAFSKDMWRGPVWLNANYLVLEGLRRYGMTPEAERLRASSLAVVRQNYEEHGVLFEYYDALGVTPPRGLDRKQRFSRGQGLAPIHDFQWTACVTALLLTETPRSLERVSD